MNVTLEQQATRWLIRMEGLLTLASAAELKSLLLQWLEDERKAKQPLYLDLEHAEGIDITIMQLLWAVSQDAARTGAQITGRASHAVTLAVHEAGFDQAPGFPTQG
jgi:anti-anti-sigma regulatory factor